MNKETIIFEANEQTLTFVSGDQNYASNTVDYVEAVFRLGENWDFDVIIAVWQSKTQKIATVLGDGVCIVPTEVLAETGVVKVNLAGSDIVSGEVEERLTTYPEFALLVDATAQTSGTETQPITPSQFEQFVGIVEENADKAETAKEQAQGFAEDAEGYKDDASESATQAGEYKDEAKGYAEDAEADAEEIRNMRATANTLPAGSSATANYSDGLLTLGIPRGDTGATGATGNGIASAVLNADYTLTLNFTDGTHYTTPPIRGAQGEPGDVTLAQLASVLPTDTASGAIASFEDGSDLFDYLSCVVDIEPIQSGSGTPSPDNVRPITGWTGCEVDVVGVNLLDESTLVLGYIDSSGVVVSTSSYRASGYIKVNPNDTYTLSLNRVDGSATSVYGMRIAWYDENKAFIRRDGTNNEGTTAGIKQTSATAPSNAKYVRVSTAYSANVITDRQFEAGASATAYKPYSATTYDITWQTEAGTVYGGTVDLVTGVLTVDKVSVDLGTLTWSARPGWGGFRSVSIASDVKKPPTTSTLLANCKCSTYNQTTAAAIGMSTLYSYAIDTDGAVLLRMEDGKTASDITGQLVYSLATPQTYQLTPTQIHALLGHNNVWADCGNVEVQYKADVQRWVEKMLNA